MSSGLSRMTRYKGTAAAKTRMAIINAVPCHPMALPIPTPMRGTTISAPPRLNQFAQPIADAMRRENQLLMVVIMGTQLPMPCPRAITINAK